MPYKCAEGFLKQNERRAWEALGYDDYEAFASSRIWLQPRSYAKQLLLIFRNRAATFVRNCG